MRVPAGSIAFARYPVRGAIGGNGVTSATLVGGDHGVLGEDACCPAQHIDGSNLVNGSVGPRELVHLEHTALACAIYPRESIRMNQNMMDRSAGDG
jgi:hypothetical protein